jgi:hypothetical protein
LDDTNKPDKLARTMAALSLLVAIATAIISYVQQSSALEEQKRQFQVLQKEDLAIRLNPHVEGRATLTGQRFGSEGTLVRSFWGLTLSNTGNQKLSLTQYRISTGDSPGAYSYSGIDGGLLAADSTIQKLPIILEPGETRVLLLDIGFLVSDKVYSALSSLKESDLLSAQSLGIELARKGLDFYGNEVELHKFPEGGEIISVDSNNQKSPTIWLQITTGRGNTFTTSAATYQRGK